MKIDYRICILTLILVFFVISSCATGRQRNIEDELISAFRQEKRTVELKIDGGWELYTIDPTFKKSATGCPIALIKGWRGARQFMEKEVEVCD